MTRWIQRELAIAGAAFTVLIVIIPLMAYALFFKYRMDGPHGIGASIFIIFVVLLNPIFSFLGSVVVWQLLKHKDKR